MTLEEIGKLKVAGEYVGMKRGFSEALGRDITDDDLASTLEDRKLYVAELAARQAEECIRMGKAVQLNELARDQLRQLAASMGVQESIDAPIAIAPSVESRSWLRRLWERLVGRPPEVPTQPKQAEAPRLMVKESVVLERWNTGNDRSGPPDETVYTEQGKIVKIVKKGDQ